MRQKINSHIKKHSNSHYRGAKDENQMMKTRFFQIVAEHLKQNASLKALVYYIFQIIQAVSLFWFLIHPTLNLYSADNYLYTQITQILKYINFYEFLIDDPTLYITMAVAAFSYFFFQIVLILISIMGIHKKSDSQGFKYLKKIVNMQYIFTVKVLSGPVLGLSVNVLYCKASSPYHFGQICYQSTHLAVCLLMGIVFIALLAQIVIFATFYCIRNPFSDSFLAQSNRFYFLSKSLLKLAFPVYFAISSELNLQFLYVIFAPIAIAIYIVFHRFLSVPTFKHQHFYFQYFLEGTLLWVAASGTISYYIEGTPNREQLSLIYTILSSLLMGYVLVSVQKKFHSKFIQDCLQQKIKKQQVQKFMLSLVNSFAHVSSQQGKMTFKVYEGIILHNKNKLQLSEQTINDEDFQWMTQVYRFLLEIVEEYLQEKKNVGLTIMRCYLLQFLGNKNASLHQSFQLEQQRLSIIDEFGVYYCRHSTNCSHQLLYRNSAEQVKLFQYHQQVSLMDELIDECTQNNVQYWEQLRQLDPSIPKLRNLATLYTKYSAEITLQYQKVISILPNCLLPTLNYLLYLMEMGVDVKAIITIKQKLQAMTENKRGIDKILNWLKQDVNMIAVDTLQNNIGIIINSNSQIKKLLGYQKHTIIGKPLTKLMPQIYAQLHNSFLLNYIYKRSNETNERLQVDEQLQENRQSMDQPQKIVTALNSESLLVVIGLEVQIITTADNKLVIAGFLNKKPDDKLGLLMIEGNTGEILGFDNNFMDLMKNMISGKQLVQQQIRFSTLLPEINLESIQKGTTQETIIQLGHLSGDQDKQNLKIDVQVTLKQVKIYREHKLIFLSIIDCQAAKQSKKSKPLNPCRSKNQNEILPMLSLMNSKNNIIDSAQQISINCSQTNLIRDVGKTNELAKDLPIAKIMQDFIAKRESSGMNWIIRGSYIAIIIFLSLYLSISKMAHSNYLNFMSNFYVQMELASDMVYEEVQINYYVNSIWSVKNNNYRQNTSIDVYPLLQDSVNSLTTDLTTLIQATQQYDFGLQFNQQSQYSFNFPKTVNKTIEHYEMSLTYSSGIQNYINCARIFTTPAARNATSSPALLILQQMAIYIVSNGDETLPSIAQGVFFQFKDYSSYITEKQINQLLIIKAGLMVFCVLCLTLIIMVGRHLNKKQNEVLELYQKIKISDINQFRFKCTQYTNARNRGNKQRGRTLTLPQTEAEKSLKNIIHSFQIMKQQQENYKEQVQKQQEEQQKERQKIFELSSEESHKKKEKNTDNQKEENQALLKKNMRVRLQLQKDNERIIVLTIFILLAAVVLIGVSIYFCLSTLKSLERGFVLLQNIGTVRKNLVLLNLYTFKVTQGSTDADYFGLIQNSVKQFYKYSDLTYRELGQSIFKKVYSQIDIIQKYFSKTNAINTTLLSNLYPIIRQTMLGAAINIDLLDETVFKKQFKDIISQSSSTQLTIIIIFSIVALLSILMIHFCYIECIQTQRTNSLNMLKVLPAQLMHRSPQALESIT